MPSAHVCLMQQSGNVFSLGLLDPARYLAAQLERVGVRTTLARNRLRHGVLNVVVGGHLGFDPAWTREFPCVFLNLEQLGQGGYPVSEQYLDLLRDNPVIDYSPANVPSYRDSPADGVLIGFGSAPYLHPGKDLIPLRERPIDLLFFGSLNPRRRSLIAQIEKSGVQVALPDTLLYGPERDSIVRQAKAVLNIAFYETARFEQVRAFLVLSQGTAFISDKRALSGDHERAYADVVHWFDPRRAQEFIETRFTAPDFAERTEDMLARFAEHDPLDSVRDAWERFRDLPGEPSRAARPAGPGRPLRVNAALATRGYRPGWLNLAGRADLLPDWQVDLVDVPDLPVALDTVRWGRWTLEPGTAAQIDLGLLDPNRADLPALLGTCLTLLDEDGVAVLEWPASAALDLDPFTRRFWESGWLQHRFEVHHRGPLDARGNPCRPPDTQRWRIALRKKASTLWETTVARAAREDLGMADLAETGRTAEAPDTEDADLVTAG
jgi:hypothetical protein